MWPPGERTDWIVRDRCQVDHSVQPLEVGGRHIPDISGPLLVSVRRWAESHPSYQPTSSPTTSCPAAYRNEHSGEVAAVAVHKYPHEGLLSVLNIMSRDPRAAYDRLCLANQEAIYCKAGPGRAGI